MKEIHVRFTRIEKASNGSFSVVYVPDKRRVLLPNVEHRIVVDGLTYEESSGSAQAGKEDE